MAITSVTTTSDGVTSTFAVPFPYFQQDDVFVYVNGMTFGGSITWNSSSVISLSPVPTSGSLVTIQRWTDQDAPRRVFTNTNINAPGLNDNDRQLLYLIQELQGGLSRAVQVEFGEATQYLPTRSELKNALLWGDPDTGDLSTISVDDARQIFKGDPGGNVLSVGLWDNLGGITIPLETDLIQTSGRSSVGVGVAQAILDPDQSEGVGETCYRKQDESGRWFKLVGEITASMIGLSAASGAIAAAILEEFADAYPKLTVPKGETFAINSPAVLPSGFAIHLDGTITGAITGTAAFDWQGDATVTGYGKFLIGAAGGSGNVGVHTFREGSVVFDGPTISGAGLTRPLAGILINPSDTGIERLDVSGRFEFLRYGLLRNRFDNTNRLVRQAHIHDFTGYDLTGDCIEWNRGVLDTQVVIENFVIDYVHGTLANHGLAVGVAGLDPYAYQPPTPLTNVVIRNGHVRRAARAVHVEISQRVTVQNITFEDIAGSYSPPPAVNDPYAIYVSGSREVLVQACHGVNSSTGSIRVQIGVQSGSFVSSLENIAVRNCTLMNAGNIDILAAREAGPGMPQPVDVLVDSNYVKGGFYRIRGGSAWVIKNNVGRPAVGANGMTLNWVASTVLAAPLVNTYHAIVAIEGNDIRDKYGNVAVSIVDLYDSVSGSDANIRLFGGRNSFPLEPVNASGVATDTAPAPTGYSYIIPGSEMPVGRPFLRNELVYLRGAKRAALIRTSGQRTDSSDTYTVSVGATATIRSTGGKTWITSHTVGGRITLSGNSTNYIVDRVYVNGSAQQCMDLVLASDGSIPDLTSLADGTITATTELAWDYLDRTTANMALDIPQLSSDPASPVNGEMWINTTGNVLKVRIAGVTRTVTVT